MTDQPIDVKATMLQHEAMRKRIAELEGLLRGALTGLEVLEADLPALPGLPDLIRRCKEALK